MVEQHRLRERLRERQMRRLGIAIPLPELKVAMDEYVAERGGGDDLLTRLLLSDLLEWLRKRQLKERDNGSRTDR